MKDLCCFVFIVFTYLICFHVELLDAKLDFKFLVVFSTSKLIIGQRESWKSHALSSKNKC